MGHRDALINIGDIVMRILSKKALKELVLYSPQHIARLEKALGDWEKTKAWTKTREEKMKRRKEKMTFVENFKWGFKVQDRNADQDLRT